MLNAERKKAEPAWLEDALQRFESDNRDLIAPTNLLLERIVRDPATHARLLNTLSLLEHTGSHKIMATQHSTSIDQATLRHVAEEAHHAYFMKRQAEKISGTPLEYHDDQLLAAASARMYFQRLEASMVRELPADSPSHAGYLFMSMVVEFRALWFYRLFQNVLKQASLPISLKRILGEEHNHLTEMAQGLGRAGALDDGRVDGFLTTERGLYARMLDAIDQAARP